MFTQSIEVATDEEFILRLVATPSTAYAWALRAPVADIDLLESYFEKRTAQAAPGDTGFQVFRLRANRSGKYELIFDLKRTWEREPIDVCHATIIVCES